MGQARLGLHVGLHVRLSRRFEEFLQLEAEWDELWANAAAATPR